ncbi:flagellar export chaperone FliS [Pengzhenrongella frigida]|uniref:Flagellar export chaperone FliS n=1 Tax=Pengzhenrongella frigida TaxID=1259133 RepID=A0A4Q5MWP2_9MICO|nr:flagellar export chaperone FliS [Cellulomonas sp. HLT2-17]RYV50028.1 flagellar export chaperone FliS [Cellulomonas sp. HLT2-17]
MNLALTRIRFRENAITTAGPQQILTMLYDRLVLDLDRAAAAQRAGDRGEANKQLDHAQDIISGLASTLDIDEWSGGQSLMDLYMYLLKELVGASIVGDADRIAACSTLVVPLRDAWHEAAAAVAAEAQTNIPTQRTRALAFGESAVGGELGVG